MTSEPTKKPARPTHAATVVEAGDLCEGMRRVVLHVPGLDADLPHADHYVKLVFGDVLRTYTIRAWDPSTHRMTLDLVVHGDAGVAGPWARDVEPGATIDLRGPGGAWGPQPDDTHLLLVGDEAAAPAIARAMELAPEGCDVEVFVEVADAAHEIPLPETGARVTWVQRGDNVPGMALAHEARAYALPDDTSGFRAFVHGNADMIKDVRHWLFVELGLPKDRVSVSGYWRHGMSDEQWRATKKEFTAQLEAEERARA